MNKLVASRTRTGPLDWQNSQLVDGDLLDTVRALKATDGGRIAVSGSLSIARQLAYAALLDELILVVHRPWPAPVGGSPRTATRRCRCASPTTR